MNDHELQDDLEIIEHEKSVDFFEDDEYEPVVWENPDYAEFAGWRDLVL